MAGTRDEPLRRSAWEARRGFDKMDRTKQPIKKCSFKFLISV